MWQSEQRLGAGSGRLLLSGIHKFEFQKPLKSKMESLNSVKQATKDPMRKLHGKVTSVIFLPLTH